MHSWENNINMEYKEVGKNGQNSSGSEHLMHTVKKSLGSIKGPGGISLLSEKLLASQDQLFPMELVINGFDFLHLVDLQIF